MEHALSTLEPRPVWALFERICRIPHDSGRERALGLELQRLARENGLSAELDPAGNLIVDRPGAPGRRRLILQGHLDMVWQSPEKIEPEERRVLPRLEGDYLTAAPRSSLGADNGIGVAAALALLLEPPPGAGPLRAIFTVQEEVGLLGAAQLDAKWLEGAVLLNLDSEQEGEICLGCAGGARLTIELPLEREATPPGWLGVELEVSGLPGGHSGMDIDKHRPNAILELAKGLRHHPEIRVSHWETIGPDNAIPRASRVLGAVAPGELPDLPELRPAPLPATLWTAACRERVVTAIETMPNGVFHFDPAFNVVSGSSNLAGIATAADHLTLLTSQRGMYGNEREQATERVTAHFAALNAVTRLSAVYCNWEPAANSPLPGELKAIYRELFGKFPELKVIHAGLECGLFAERNPRLQMASFGPTIEAPHSPSERLRVSSVARFYRFLRTIVERLA